ncbi:hypothetical protein L208DRAFT_1400712 [Tricholoma matsutake]|nr:hypothetical protein L208DRAFT_1400712 [Tricholoma matsutake 945]
MSLTAWPRILAPGAGRLNSRDKAGNANGCGRVYCLSTTVNQLHDLRCISFTWSSCIESSFLY